MRCSWLLRLCLALLATPLGPVVAADTDASVDLDALRLTTQETRLNRLAAMYSDVGVKLPPQEAFGFTNSNQVHDLRARVNRGQAKRDELLKKGPQLLKKREAQIEKTLGDHLSQAKEQLAKPLPQAELFVLLLTDFVVDQRPLTAAQEKARTMLGKRLAKLFEQSNRRPPVEHDADWLATYQKETTAELEKLLGPDGAKALDEAWRVLFPDGPTKPQ